MHFKLRLGATLAAATALTGLLAPPASATTPYAQQARAAGLTASQTATLQHRVSAALSTFGGHQIAANEIAISGGSVLLPLPGEKYARELTSSPQPLTAAGPAATENCLVGDFCVSSGENGEGTFERKYVCSDFNIPWSTHGTWINDQSGKVRGKFYASSNESDLIYTTTLPVSYDENYPWAPVNHILPC